MTETKRVLITGATGFIGSRLAAEMQSRGYEVHAAVYPGHADRCPEGVVCHEADLTDAASADALLAAGRFEEMIHLAWYVGPKCHMHDLNINWVTSTLNILQSFAKYGGKKFAGAGTCSEYEYKYGYLREDETPTDPQTLYGNGKAAVYNIAKVFCRQHGIDFKWPRIFNLYGPGERAARLMPSVINSCLKGDDVKVSDCLKFQDYLYVDDTARGIADVFESGLQGAVNVCSGQPVQLRQIVSTIAELTDFKGKILWGAVPAAFGDDLVVGNNEKLKSTGWKQKYSLEEGLKLTINWWRTHNV